MPVHVPQRRTPLFDLPVYVEDAHLLVVGKPAGVLPHRTHPRPQISLHEMARREWWQDAQLQIAHRLDRETSGLMVLGRTTAATRYLAGQFEARKVNKTYLAIVEGHMLEPCGQVTAAIGRAAPGAVRKKQAVDGIDAKACKTAYRVVAETADLSLLEVTPEGGRSHQIRVHLSYLGHPLVGDKLYGPDEQWHLRFQALGWTAKMAQALRLPRHALHASSLQFAHPDGGAQVSVQTDLPDDLAAFWQAQPQAADCTAPLQPLGSLA